MSVFKLKKIIEHTVEEKYKGKLSVEFSKKKIRPLGLIFNMHI